MTKAVPRHRTPRWRISPRWRLSPRRRLYRWIALIIAALLLWELLAWGAASFLVTRSDPESADALVLLSGAPNYLERAEYAAELWRARRAPRILLTNDGTRGPWSEAEQRNPFFFEKSTTELRRHGVSVESIYVLPQVVVSTYQEAEAVRTYAEAHGIRSLLVVTSAYHSRRASWTYQRVFRDSKIRVDVTATQSIGNATWWLSASGWQTVPVEYIKLIYYRIHYR